MFERPKFPPVMAALITPFSVEGKILWEDLGKLIKFLGKNGIKGFVPMGTTGESCTVTPAEHCEIVARVATMVAQNIRGSFLMPGAGSNSTAEAEEYVSVAVESGADAVMLVVPYYNKPASEQILREYIQYLAEKFPEIAIVVYLISSRTAKKFAPADLYTLVTQCPNVVGVKYAEPGFDDLKEIRQYMPNFPIFSGDDNRTLQIMREFGGSGVISVMAHIAPKPIVDMCEAALMGNWDEATRITRALSPLFELVTIPYERIVCIPGWVTKVQDAIPNPVPVKAIMAGLGMISSGFCRRPLGKMPESVILKIQLALEDIWRENPWVLEPIADFFVVDIEKRIYDHSCWKDVMYYFS